MPQFYKKYSVNTVTSKENEKKKKEKKETVKELFVANFNEPYTC